MVKPVPPSREPDLSFTYQSELDARRDQLIRFWWKERIQSNGDVYFHFDTYAWTYYNDDDGYQRFPYDALDFFKHKKKLILDSFCSHLIEESMLEKEIK